MAETAFDLHIGAAAEQNPWVQSIWMFLADLFAALVPVLPFAFVRADGPFLRGGLPMLVGLSLGFAAIATLATVAAGWAATANDVARVAALVMLTGTGLALLVPKLATMWSR